jgi:hypothetical protein
MKNLIIIFTLLSSLANADENISGIWKYVGYSYQGVQQPLPNPALDLRFNFEKKQTSYLQWYYENEKGICQRQAYYEVQAGNWLYQRVTWVNPNNHISCAKDPDMQLGKESFTPFRIENDQLLFELELNGSPFTFILDRLSSPAEQMEQLLGFTYDREGITLQVNSGGCTKKSDFTFIKGVYKDIPTLAFYRSNTDTCLAYYPHGIKIHFTYAELGINGSKKFYILNQIEQLGRNHGNN